MVLIPKNNLSRIINILQERQVYAVRQLFSTAMSPKVFEVLIPCIIISSFLSFVISWLTHTDIELN